jgi:hypothetical protein
MPRPAAFCYRRHGLRDGIDPERKLFAATPEAPRDEFEQEVFQVYGIFCMPGVAPSVSKPHFG